MLWPISSEMPSMRVIGWSNSQPLATGAGYGVRLSGHDRDDYFDPGWHEVALNLDRGETVSVSLSKSFWRSCQSCEALQSGDGFSAITSHHGRGGCLQHWSYTHISGNCFDSGRRSPPARAPRSRCPLMPLGERSRSLRTHSPRLHNEPGPRA